MPAGGAAPATALISASVNSTGSDKPSSFAIFDDIEASSRLEAVVRSETALPINGLRQRVVLGKRGVSRRSDFEPSSP
jgi:hypothetical protein